MHWHNFLQRAPFEAATQNRGRAIAPLKATHTFFTPLRGALRGVIPIDEPCTAQEMKIASPLTCFWNAADMKSSYFERAFAGTLRYQHRGMSELILIPYDMCVVLFGKHVGMKTEILDLVQKLTEAEMQEHHKKGAIWRVLLKQGNILCIPPATLIVERSVNNTPSYGIRVMHLHVDHLSVFSRAFDHVVATHAQHPHLPAMQALKTSFQALHLQCILQNLS